jgi:drug/metabolite transporter (DMT)-like permease
LHPWAIVVHYSGLATLVVLASWAVGSPPDLTVLTEGTTLFLLLGVGITATVGQVCVTQAFTAGQPERISVVGLMQVVFALGLDLVFAGPTLPAVALAGIALVLAPTAWMMIGKATTRTPRLRTMPVIAPRRWLYSSPASRSASVATD